MVELTYPMLLQTLQTAGIFVGIIYYLVIMRNSQRNQEQTLKTRKMEASAMFSNWWTQKENVQMYYTVASIEDFSPEKVRYAVNPETQVSLMCTINVMSICGKMLEDGIIDPEFLWQTFYPNMIIGICERVIPYLDGFKEISNDPEIGKSIKYLYNVTKRKYPNIEPGGLWRRVKPGSTT